ncbi:DNA-deoxyinosine glycosylase [bacterium]|nr:DNA-deoxyinosine glycosylase [bacterium]
MTPKDGLPNFPHDNSETKILILGTFPSTTALETGEYYSNKGNMFWDMLEDVLSERGLKDLSYKNKEQVLTKYKITLWDIIRNCEREGAADANIIQETAKPTNIRKKFLGNKKTLEIIIINGVSQKNNDGTLGSRGWFEHFYGDIKTFETENKVKVVCLHQTSSMAKKDFNIKEWEDNIRPYINYTDNKKPKAFVIKKNKT